MPAFDPFKFLASLHGTHPRLLFYPSSGASLLSHVCDLDYDVFVFADNGLPDDPVRRREFWGSIGKEFHSRGRPMSLHRSTVRSRVFQTGGKWVFLFFRDNNWVLDKLRRASYEISGFIGIRDGCAEGGNYECVNELPFLLKVVEAATVPMHYYADHSSPLIDPRRSMVAKADRDGESHVFFKEQAVIERVAECRDSERQVLGAFLLGAVLVRRKHLADWYDSDERDRIVGDPCSYAVFNPARRKDFKAWVAESGLRDDPWFKQVEASTRSWYWDFDNPSGCNATSHPLVPFRTQHREGIIAMYLVYKRPGYQAPSPPQRHIIR